MHVCLWGRERIFHLFLLFCLCGQAHLCAYIWITLLIQSLQWWCSSSFQMVSGYLGLFLPCLSYSFPLVFLLVCQMEEEPFNPDYVDVDRVLEVSSCEDKDTGEVKWIFFHLLITSMSNICIFLYLCLSAWTLFTLIFFILWVLWCLCISEVPKTIIVYFLAAFINNIKRAWPCCTLFSSSCILPVTGGGVLPSEVVLSALRGQHLGAEGRCRSE